MKRGYKIFISFIITNVVVISFILLSHYISESNVVKMEGEKERETYLSIVTTNKFLYSMVRDITKDMHEVTYMMKDQKSQWNFKYTQDSIKNISKKDLFIYFGASYEPWASTFVDELKRDNVTVLNASRGIRIMNLNSPIKYNDRVIKENPYYWLNPEEYKTALLNIKNAIGEKDPKNLSFYDKNFNEEMEQVDLIISKLREVSEKLQNSTFVLTNDNLDYFFKFTGLNYIKIPSGEGVKNEDIQKAYDKLGTTENLIYIYSDKEDLKNYEKLIKDCKMRTVEFLLDSEDIGYKAMMNKNIENLEKVSGNTEMNK
ncbi:metal ABC transporter substrate-binding protein [Clostridium sp.]|uniref:metal ABC transporter substrate-binding protein n=1 Tax=Clostridium sp. TaxID=1506 RepID=UPI003464A8B4